jgi:hypothetical protein
MMNKLLQWLRDRKLHQLKARLAGLKANLAEEHAHGCGNGYIAGEIAIAQYKINVLEQQNETQRQTNHAAG